MTSRRPAAKRATPAPAGPARSRPLGRRGPSASPSAVAPPGRADRARLTGRAAVLFLVVGLLLVAFAWPMREYLRQRARIDALRQQVAASTREVADLEAERARWRDPAYVEAQARTRLHFVRPGEVAYVVVRPGGPVDSIQPTRPAPPSVAWFEALWQTVRVADGAG